MRYRRIIAAALCLSLVCGTGCSLGKDSSSKALGSSSFSSSTKKYDLTSFSFEISDELTVKEKKDQINGEGVYNYIFTGGGLDEISVYTMGLEQCSAEVSVQAMVEGIEARENDPAKDIETEKLEIPGFNAAAIHMTNSSEEGDKGESHLCLSTEGIQFNVSVYSYEPGDRDNIKALFREIAKTVKYTGKDHLPTEPQSFDCDYFSLKCGPEWYIKNQNSKNNNPDEAEIRLNYYYAQDMEHYLAPSLSIMTRVEDEESNPQTAAEKAYKSKLESRLTSEAEKGTDEIFGYTAETVSFVLETGSIKNRYKNYYFSENGYMYVVTKCLNMRDEEGSNAELQTLIDNITIKKFTPEELARRQQEREAAAYQNIEFSGAEYTLDSKFELQRDYNYGKDFRHKSKDMYITMLRDENYGGDFKNYFEKEAGNICFFNGLKEVYSHRVILGDNNDSYEVIDYVNREDTEANGETCKTSVYYLDAGRDALVFSIGYPEKDEETAIKYISNMLSSKTNQ